MIVRRLTLVVAVVLAHHAPFMELPNWADPGLPAFNGMVAILVPVQVLPDRVPGA